jgi:hypothetical protein
VSTANHSRRVIRVAIDKVPSTLQIWMEKLYGREIASSAWLKGLHTSTYVLLTELPFLV